MSALLKTRAVKKDDAFAVRENDERISIDKSKHRFKFTRRWFVNRNQTTFSTKLPPRFPNDKPWNILQIGVFEGMDLVWTCQNLLGHEDSRVLAIDPWGETRKLNQEKMDAVYARARRNLKPWMGSKLDIVRGKSQEILQLIQLGTQIHGKMINAGEWDLIIIDGDHNADPVYEDATLSFQLCRPGGWLLFDDVRNRSYKKNHVYHGLIAWLLEQSDKVDLVWAHRFMNCYEKKK